jgi:hypothetical protein
MHRWQAAAIAVLSFAVGVVAGFGVWERLAWEEVEQGMKNWR